MSIGIIPGMIGILIPADNALSRNRRKVSFSKKNWDIILSAPSSTSDSSSPPCFLAMAFRNASGNFFCFAENAHLIDLKNYQG